MEHWTCGSGYINLAMTREQAQSATHAGPCDTDIRTLSQVPEIAAQLAAMDPTHLAAALQEYGAWDTDELADHAQNQQRILWIAAGDIADRQ